MVAVRNIALSYTFPEKWLGKIGANSCQIYGQVLNPFIWGGDLYSCEPIRSIKKRVISK